MQPPSKVVPRPESRNNRSRGPQGGARQPAMGVNTSRQEGHTTPPTRPPPPPPPPPPAPPPPPPGGGGSDCADAYFHAILRAIGPWTLRRGCEGCGAGGSGQSPRGAPSGPGAVFIRSRYRRRQPRLLGPQDVRRQAPRGIPRRVERGDETHQHRQARNPDRIHADPAGGSPAV